MDPSAGNVLTIKTVQIAPFRTLMTALKDILIETNISFRKDGIRIINMDKSHTMLAHCRLAAENFEYYDCKEEKILIYPNPSSDFIHINTNESNYQMDLYSISGQLIKSYTNPVSIDLRSIQNGIYILHIRNNKGQNEKRKIIVQKE